MREQHLQLGKGAQGQKRAITLLEATPDDRLIYPKHRQCWFVTKLTEKMHTVQTAEACVTTCKYYMVF